MRSEDPNYTWRRRLLVRALAGGFSASALLGSRVRADEINGGRPARLPPGQSVFRADGRILANGVPVSVSTHIGAGDTIESGSDGLLVFAVGQSAFHLRGNSRVRFEADAGDAGEVGAIHLEAGKLLSVFVPGRPKSLATPTARIATKGTGIYLETDPEQTYFCTCYGVTEVSAVTDPTSSASIVSSHHSHPVYVLAKASAGAAVRSAPFISHTDQELMLIENLVGRSTPFALPSSLYDTPRRTDRYR